MDEETRVRMEQAVERKKDEARRRSEQHDPTGSVPPGSSPAGIDGDQHGLISDDRGTQDALSPRAKNSGKGKKTADKWNQ
jgi:hypothetical protein